jgi:hypothetical protein
MPGHDLPFPISSQHRNASKNNQYHVGYEILTNLTGYNAESVESQRTFRKNMSPPSSVSKASACYLLYSGSTLFLFSNPGEGGCHVQKCLLTFNGLHDITIQEMEFFTRLTAKLTHVSRYMRKKKILITITN